jgi:DNA-binding response OmpR family regulator
VKAIIIEDSATVKFSVTKLLQEHGYDTQAFSSIKEIGLDDRSSEDLSIIILDYELPEANGKTCLNIIRKWWDFKGKVFIFSNQDRSVLEEAVICDNDIVVDEKTIECLSATILKYT